MQLIGGYSKEAEQYPLHDYQIAAVDFLLDRLTVQDATGAGCFLDPGLGKTRITLATIDLLFAMRAIERVLVVAPLRPLYTVWPAERIRWGFPQPQAILHKQLDRMLPKSRPIELMNFGSLKKIADFKNRWDLIVIDESTYIKNWSTQRMKYVKSMIKTIPKRVILTGTPAANCLTDLFSQMYVVDNGESLGRTITAFRSAYCQPAGWQGRGWAIRKGTEKQLYGAIQDRVLRLQAEDFLDMPDLVQNEIYVQLPPKTMAQYRRFEKELIAELDKPEATQVYAANMASAYIKCRQLAAGPVYKIDVDGRRQPAKNISGYEYAVAHGEKVKALEELAEMLPGKPMLVAYNFTHELAEILQSPIFKKAGVINGKTSASALEKTVNKWNAGELQYLVVQWRAASHGLNLQHGSCGDLVAFSLTDSPETYEQWYRRVYRQGAKTTQVRVHRLIARDTVDEVQLARLEGKFKTQAEFLGALKENAKQHLSKK